MGQSRCGKAVTAKGAAPRLSVELQYGVEEVVEGCEAPSAAKDLAVRVVLYDRLVCSTGYGWLGFSQVVRWGPRPV